MPDVLAEDELHALIGHRFAGSVGLESDDWEYLHPLREGVEYRIDGDIVSGERTVGEQGAIVDQVAFRIELFDDDVLVAPGDEPLDLPQVVVNVRVVDEIPAWTMAAVDQARMKTMATTVSAASRCRSGDRSSMATMSSPRVASPRSTSTTAGDRRPATCGSSVTAKSWSAGLPL